MEILKRSVLRRIHTIITPTIFLLLVLGFVLPVSAQTDDRKNKIEAAFLYNFFNYITWPEENQPAGNTATICIYNNPALEDALHYVRIQKAAERKLAIISVKSLDIPDACKILYISNTNGANLGELGARGVLLVSDAPGFAMRGGMIELVEEKERITLDINHTVLTNSGFQVSSRLLGIARIVK
jgi:hypothetical protein